MKMIMTGKLVITFKHTVVNLLSMVIMIMISKVIIINSIILITTFKHTVVNLLSMAIWHGYHDHYQPNHHTMIIILITIFIITDCGESSEHGQLARCLEPSRRGSHTGFFDYFPQWEFSFSPIIIMIIVVIVT